MGFIDIGLTITIFLNLYLNRPLYPAQQRVEKIVALQSSGHLESFDMLGYKHPARNCNLNILEEILNN